MDVDSRQVLAFRLAGQGLDGRCDDPVDALRRWTVQESPPGAATTAALARTTAVDVGWLDAAVL